MALDRARVTRLADDVVNGRGTKESPKQGIRMKTITDDNGVKITAIEQNPNTNSEWAARARNGEKVVQLRQDGRYVGAVVDGKLIEY